MAQFSERVTIPLVGPVTYAKGRAYGMKVARLCAAGLSLMAVTLLLLSCSALEEVTIHIAESEVEFSPVIRRPRHDEGSQEPQILAELPMIHEKSMIPRVDVGDTENYFYPGAFTVPIKINRTEYAFIVDTGSSLTLLDADHRSLLGEPLFMRKATESFTPFEVKFYRLTGSVEIGRLMYTNSIGCIDFRKKTGLHIDGIIGRDILELDGHVVQFDFVEKKLRIMRIEDLPGWKVNILEASWGTELPLSKPHYALGGVSVNVPLSEDITESLIIDTGLWGPAHLRRELFERLEESPNVKPVGSGDKELLYVRRLSFKGMDVSDVYFMPKDNTPAGSYLGVQFLGRFSKVTIDFKRSKLFLVPQKKTAREMLLEDKIVTDDMLLR